MPKFLDPGDAMRMLRGGVVSYKGRLILVTNVNGGNVMSFTDVETGEMDKAPADFDIIQNPTKGRLGYVNLKQGCAYVARAAARITRMGLSAENLQVVHIHQAVRAGMMRRWNNYMFEGMSRTYQNLFPSFDEAYEKAVDKGIPTAFDRSFAIDRDGSLYYQGRLIGEANPRGEEFSKLNLLGEAIKPVRHCPKLKWREHAQA